MRSLSLESGRSRQLEFQDRLPGKKGWRRERTSEICRRPLSVFSRAPTRTHVQRNIPRPQVRTGARDWVSPERLITKVKCECHQNIGRNIVQKLPVLTGREKM